MCSGSVGLARRKGDESVIDPDTTPDAVRSYNVDIPNMKTNEE